MKLTAAWLTAAVAVVLHVPITVHAQLRSDGPGPVVGIIVDTLPPAGWGERWKTPVAAIYHRWAEFLRSTAPRYTAPGAAPSQYWSLPEQQRWITFPLALSFVSPSAAATVLDIRPATPGEDSVYVVKTLFRAGAGSAGQPEALVRVYAVREHGTWVFSNALPRTTRRWERVTIGPFDYAFPHGYRFDRARAQRAVAFADSVASAFAMPTVAHVAYYLTESPDEMNRIIGLDWYPSASEGGAFSSGANRLLVSGDAAMGENYRHEIVHVVLGPLSLRGVHPLVWEGVATWLGGTLGMEAGQVRREYAAFLRAHPEVTLESILHQSRDQGFRPAGAVLCRMAFDRGGIGAVKSLLGGGVSDAELKASLERTLGKSWPAIQSDWRGAAQLP